MISLRSHANQLGAYPKFQRAEVPHLVHHAGVRDNRRCGVLQSSKKNSEQETLHSNTRKKHVVIFWISLCTVVMLVMFWISRLQT